MKDKQRKQAEPKKQNNALAKGIKKHHKWFIFIIAFSFSMALLFGFLAGDTLQPHTIPACITIIVVLIMFAFVCDIFSVACAYADITVFNSMASRRIRGARKAIYLVKHSDKVSSILSDVVGDVCAVVSGASGVALSLVIVQHGDYSPMMQAFIIALVNAITASSGVTAKSIAKKIAIAKSTEVVLFLGRVLSAFSKR